MSLTPGYQLSIRSSHKARDAIDWLQGSYLRAQTASDLNLEM
jgi:hypothetical protein